MLERIDDVGVMLDCSRNAVMNLQSLKRFIKMISQMGYTSLQLYLEDTYEIDDNPYFGYMRGRYTKAELKEIDAFAKENGIELIPCIQTLAHLNQIFKWPPYWFMRDTDDILLAESDSTYALIENMFKTCAECFSTKRIHIGMDEAHNIGKGRYRDIHGDRDKFSILINHLTKVVDIATKYGFKPMMWCDMFFRLVSGGSYVPFEKALDENIKKLVPKNLSLVYYDYCPLNQDRYDKMIESLQEFDNETVFAGGAWSWVGFASHNQYSIETTIQGLKSCLEHNVKSVFTTLWGDNGRECSPFSLSPSLYCFAEFAHGNFNMEIIKQKFQKLFGVSFDDMMNFDLPDKIEENELAPVNPSKNLLYNDPFTGLLNYAVFNDANKFFAEKVTILRKLEDNEEFGYIFKSHADLCDALSIKAELGVKLRKAYKEQNRAELTKIIDDFKECTKRMEKFYISFRALWNKENKSFGFEVHDIRLGGIIQRMKDCTMTLEDYISGKIDRIYELDEETLTYFGNDGEIGKPTRFKEWHNMVTSSVL